VIAFCEFVFLGAPHLLWSYVGIHFRLLFGYDAIKAYIGEYGYGADRPEEVRRTEVPILANVSLDGIVPEQKPEMYTDVGVVVLSAVSRSSDFETVDLVLVTVRHVRCWA
jgi:hypothetical protein